jgi:Hydantoinase/oxoprolinase N-terminal region
VYYVGVDIGGTFTDCVLVDRYGNHRTAKVLSAKDGPVAGVHGCAVLERPLRTVAPEFATRPGRAGYLMRYREYLCPVTGLRVDSEILADGGEALHDIVIGDPAGFPT